MDYLPSIQIEPENSADATVIWLHGLGASGYDLEPIVPELALPVRAAVRFVFPHAPSIPITINGGYIMPGWYDIREMDVNRKIDEEQLLASAHAVHALVDREIESGIDSRRIIIAGFSQGGAVGYQAALTYPRPLAGLLAMSSYFATAESMEPDPANRALAIAIYHGTADLMVPESLGRQSCLQLLEMGYSPIYKSYPMDHAICAEEIADISQWLQNALL